MVFGFEPATARFTPDGKLMVFVGIQNHGQGLETTLAQVAHQELGIPIEDVIVRHGDTGVSPYGMGTFASRSMTMAGGAVARVSVMLAEKVKRIGAGLLQAPADQVTLADGRVMFGTASVTLRDVAQAAYLHPERLPVGEEPSLEVTATYEPGASTGAFAYATHACTVAVDPGTGLVEILDYVVCHDCGTMVNPMIVEAQVVGGVAQGIGTALYEEIPYDSNGQPLASTFLDYVIPGASEVPDVRVLHMETPSPHTKYGIKGMGEGGAIAPPAAVINAINDALRSSWCPDDRNPGDARTGAGRHRRGGRLNDMKPAPFSYIRPDRLASVVDALAPGETLTKIIAGGQSLVPMLNLRLAPADRLVDIRGLDALRQVEERPDSILYGALLTHAAFEDRKVPDASNGLMPHMASGIAFRSVRNRGTIGGALALADPAADWLATAVALEARMHVHGPDGDRVIPAEDFVLGPYFTALGEADVLTAIEVPRRPATERWGVCKVSVKVGEYAESLAIALLDRARGSARVVVGATDGAPLVLTRTAQALLAGAADQDLRAIATQELAGSRSRLQPGKIDHARHHRPAGQPGCRRTMITTQVSMTVNGEPVSATVEPRTHLADFLRETLRFTAVHLGCEHGVCGACTVLIDGEPVRSCITLAVAVDGADIRTLEGLQGDPVMEVLKRAFHDKHGLQCGFCTPGMLIAARDLLQRRGDVSAQDIRVAMAGNLCRCTGYQGIVRAIMAARDELAAGGNAGAPSGPVRGGRVRIPTWRSPRPSTSPIPSTASGGRCATSTWSPIACRAPRSPGTWARTATRGASR